MKLPAAAVLAALQPGDLRRRAATPAPGGSFPTVTKMPYTAGGHHHVIDMASRYRCHPPSWPHY